MSRHPIVIHLQVVAPGQIPGQTGPIALGIQVGEANPVLVPAAGEPLHFHASASLLETSTGLDFRGEAIFGKPKERFVYLGWFNGEHVRFARSKIMLPCDDLALLEAAAKSGTLSVSLRLIDEKNRPRYASVRTKAEEWSASEQPHKA